MQTFQTVLNIFSTRMSLLHGLYLVFLMLLTISLFLFPTQISWNSIALHPITCMFPIPLVMIFLFVYRKALLLIWKLITPITLGRRILFRLKIMPICQFVQAS